jgi:diacylglycerol kinase (CTP)
MPLKARTDIHLARRIWHFVGVMVIYFLYWWTPPAHNKLTALAFSVPLIAIDVTRLFYPPLNKAMMVLFKPFMREAEKHRLAALSFMLAGATINIFIFPRPVVYLSLLFLGIADPVASFIGIRYGKDKLIGNKSLQGSFAAFAVCFLITAVFLIWQHLMMERLFIVCLLSGLIGAVSELMPVWKLDDNLVFPVLSAFLLTGLFHVFGGL